MKCRTKSGIQTNLNLIDDSNADWLPKCDEPAAVGLILTGESRFIYPHASPLTGKGYPSLFIRSAPSNYLSNRIKMKGEQRDELFVKYFYTDVSLVGIRFSELD